MEDDRHNRPVRRDYRAILAMVEPNSRVLDLGCGSGELLRLLAREKGVSGQGVEINPENISQCVTRGVPAIQADVDQGLKDYQDKSFDYVILNQTLQVVRNPERVLMEMARVGRRAVVGFPNWGFVSTRLYPLFWGRMPVTREYPYAWHESPDIHPLTVADFEDLCSKRGLEIVSRVFLGRVGEVRSPLFASWRTSTAIFQVRKG